MRALRWAWRGSPMVPAWPRVSSCAGAGRRARSDDSFLQEPRRSPERPPPETFTVGTETFFWTPFPAPPPGRGGNSGGSDLVLSAVRGRTGSPQQYAAPELRGTPSAEEQPSEEQPSQRQSSVDGAMTLQSCPMCQVDFAPG